MNGIRIGNITIDGITLMTAFGAVATLVLFLTGFMAVASREITLKARHSPRQIISGSKAVVIGIGMMIASVFVGLAFYFAITTRSMKEPVGYFVLGAFISLMIGYALSIFVSGNMRRKSGL